MGILFLELRRLDAQLSQKPISFGAIGCRTVDFKSAAVHQLHLAAEMKLVPPGVTTDVVVVFEDQDFGRLTRSLAIKVCSGKAANAPADHDQVISLGEFDRGSGMFPEGAITKRMRRLERTWMASTHAGKVGRVSSFSASGLTGI